MKSLWLLLGIVCVLPYAAAGSVNYVALTPPVSMPDGSSFLTWNDETKYVRSYHVDQAHPRAADGNPGTAELPFRTINRAAQVVKPGRTLTVARAEVYADDGKHVATMLQTLMMLPDTSDTP